MKSKELNYVVLLRACDRQYFLLWRDGGDVPDEYVLLPGSSCFLLGKTAADILGRAAKLGLQVADQEPAVVDIDKVFRLLAALRPERLSSTKTCQHLLDGWNALEDMARSIGVRLDDADFGESEMLRAAYDKLFYGNNLPAVTPDDQSYSPLFSSSERKAMRAYLRRLWKEIFERGGMIAGD